MRRQGGGRGEGGRVRDCILVKSGRDAIKVHGHAFIVTVRMEEDKL